MTGWKTEAEMFLWSCHVHGCYICPTHNRNPSSHATEITHMDVEEQKTVSDAEQIDFDISDYTTMILCTNQNKHFPGHFL